MPRRTSAPLKQAQKSRIRLPRRGSIIKVLDPQGNWHDALVTSANYYWTNVRLEDGSTTWVPTSHLGV